MGGLLPSSTAPSRKMTRAIFEELGLNVTAQSGSSRNPQPHNTLGLGRENPRRRWRSWSTRPPGEAQDFSDPRPQLRVVEEGGRPAPSPRAAHPRQQEPLEELRGQGLHPRLRVIEGRREQLGDARQSPGPAVCSNDYLGLADHPQVQRGAAEAALRWLAPAPRGSSSGSIKPHRELEGELAGFKGSDAALILGGGLADAGTIQALAGPATRCVLSTPTSCALPRRGPLPVSRGPDLRLPPRRPRAPRLRRGKPATGLADRHRRRLLDGRRRLHPSARS